MPTSIKVFAPASVANVAVGYDIMGFAINGPGDEIIIKPGNKKGLVITTITGAKSKLPFDPMKNTAGYSAMRLLKDIGRLDEPIEMEIHKKMPFGSGLGSSAASAVAGVYGVSSYLKTGLEKSELLRYAVEGEEIADGAFHADNVGPSLLGGLVIIRDNASLDFKKIYIPEGLKVAVIYPHVEVLTRDSRAILKDHVNLPDFIGQTGNLAAFVAGMYTSDFDMISRSLKDLVIEPQRAKLIPHFYDIKNIALEQGALGFSISGAGPSMFALCNNSITAENIKDKTKAYYKKAKIKVDVYLSEINQEGAFVY